MPHGWFHVDTAQRLDVRSRRRREQHDQRASRRMTERRNAVDNRDEDVVRLTHSRQRLTRLTIITYRIAPRQTRRSFIADVVEFNTLQIGSGICRELLRRE